MASIGAWAISTRPSRRAISRFTSPTEKTLRGICPTGSSTDRAQTESLLKEWAPTPPGITVGASLRTVRQNVPPPTSAAALVAISSNRNEALSLLKTTHEAAAFTRVSFIVRTHPTIPVEDLFALFASKPNVQLSTGLTLAEDLSRVSAVAYSSSTVALEVCS